jgi:DNA-binding MarR family transcriptional regulator
MGRIEQLIKQVSFRTEQHRATISLLYAANLINQHHADIFERFGLSLQQYNVLRILRGQHPQPSTINLIRERMLDKMSDASRIVERLRKAELVERLICPDDRRAVDVVITKKGLRLLAQIDKLEDEMELGMSGLTEKDAKQLNQLLEKILASLSEAKDA